jgi:hypothetical protein
LLIVLVALAGVSTVFTQDEIHLTFTPPAACPGERVTFAIPGFITFTTGTVTDVVGGGISVAAMSRLDGPILSSDPVGLIASPECSLEKGECTFVVSESARCGRYTVTYTEENNFGLSVSGIFDVAGPCCAVGGCVQPVNTFALVSPWLVAIGLIGCIGTVVVVAKKREK